MENKELQELQNVIKNNINKIKDHNNLDKLYNELQMLRKSLDHHDGVIENFVDGVKRFLSNNKNRCIVELCDIVKDFDEYSSDDKKKTILKLEELSKIKDRTFLDKIISVLRAS